jgi:hypothetical protein
MPDADHTLNKIADMISRPAATGLLTLMEDISEAHYCAGWMSDLEYSLWRIVQGGDPLYGMFPISEERVEALRWLSDQAGGWWTWDDKDGEKFVPLHQWRPMFKRHEKGRVDV